MKVVYCDYERFYYRVTNNDRARLFFSCIVYAVSFQVFISVVVVVVKSNVSC